MWVWGPRLRAPSAFAPPAAPAPLAGRASRANMGREAELLRIARKLEKMVARKNTVRLQGSGHPPPPGGAARASRESRGRVLARRPGGACGTPGPEGGAAGARRSAPWGLLGSTGWACAGPRALGRVVRAPQTRLVHTLLD